MSNTRELLESYPVESAAPFDLAIVIVGYVRQTSDSESAQMNVVQGVLHRWEKANAAHAAPELKVKTKYISDRVDRVIATLEQVRDELVK